MQASVARRELVFDWAFLVGVLFKAIDGAAEVLGGLPLLFIPPDRLSGIAHALTAGELAEDPTDPIATLILHEAAKLTHGGILVAGIYLLVHGVVKLAIVVALVRGSRRVYPWAIGALSLLALVQIVDLVAAFSVGVLLLTVMDLVIVWLTVREWRHGRTLHEVVRARAPWAMRFIGRDRG